MTSTATSSEAPASSHLPLVGLGVVVLSWGAGPVITKLITTPPLVGVLLRFGLSFPLLFLLVHLRNSRVSARTFRQAALPGIAFGINLIFVFAALQEATVAVLAVAVALQPALLLLIAGPMFGEKPTTRHILWTLLGVAGAAGVVLGAGNDLRASSLGVVLALLALFSFSTYFVLTRWARSTTEVDPFEWMAAINLWAFVAAIPPALLVLNRADFDTLDGADWFWLCVLAYVTGVFGHVLMSWVHGYIEVGRSSLYLLGMNLVAVLLAWPVHDEPVNALQAVAGLVVLGSVAAVIRMPPRPDAGGTA